MSSKRQVLINKMSKLQDELERLERYNRDQVGKILLSMYDKNEIDSEKIKQIIAKVLGDDTKKITSENKTPDTESITK